MVVYFIISSSIYIVHLLIGVWRMIMNLFFLDIKSLLYNGNRLVRPPFFVQRKCGRSREVASQKGFHCRCMLHLWLLALPLRRWYCQIFTSLIKIQIFWYFHLPEFYYQKMFLFINLITQKISVNISKIYNSLFVVFFLFKIVKTYVDLVS